MERASDEVGRIAHVKGTSRAEQASPDPSLRMVRTVGIFRTVRGRGPGTGTRGPGLRTVLSPVPDRLMWLLVLLLLAVVFIVVATTRWNLHAFLALLVAALGYGVASGTMRLQEVVAAVNEGFGGTLGEIGIVILAGSVIGTFLDRSGGARRLARSVLDAVGEDRVPLAMSGIGSIVSIPVFCDAGFVVLAPLGRALSRRAGITLASTAMALSLGLYATHHLVPPTPGPVAAAGILKADLGRVILWGLPVAAAALAAGWLFAVTVAARVEIPPGEVEDDDVDGARADDVPDRETESRSDGPTTTRALLPIFVPIVLIVLGSIGELPGRPFGEGRAFALIRFLGQPMAALLVGVGLALLLPRRLTKEMVAPSGWMGEAVTAAATIIIITGCGGAFGNVLQSSGIGEVIEAQLGGDTALGIWLPLAIAAALKIAQGSGTVAIVTAASITAPLLETIGMVSPTGRALAVVGIGAGAMMVSHANDSYFWVVTQLSDMSVDQGFRLQTLGTLAEGAAATCAVWLLSLILL